MKRLLTIILTLVMVVSVFAPFTASAANELTIVSVTQISDTQVLIKFSEPIAVNYLGNNYGPYCAIRLVDDNNTLIYDNGSPMQLDAAIRFTDSTHDTLIFEYGGEYVNITTFLNLEGDWYKFRGMGYHAALCIEEVPINGGGGDLLIDNITTADGKVKLTGNRSIGWTGFYDDLSHKDFSITVDPEKFEDAKDPDIGVDYGTILSLSKVKRAETEADTKEDKKSEETTSSDNTSSKKESGFNKKFILLGAAVVAAVIIVVGVLAATPKKKPEEAKAEEKKEEGENK